MIGAASLLSPPRLGPGPAEVVARALPVDRRALVVGPPGVGKSTLVERLGDILAREGRVCHCLGADPGMPMFGIPGAVCLARRGPADWQLDVFEALCSLDAGRFRLPLVSAVRRLTRRLDTGVLLVDGPGVVRGVAGAELLSGIVEAAGIDVVLVLTREGRPVPLAQEIRALAVEAYEVPAAAGAARPGKRARARHRTRLWDRCLAGAAVRTFDLDSLSVIGTPPPRDAPAAWVGRQVAFLEGDHTTVMGEVLTLSGRILRVRLPAAPGPGRTLLIRDAQRTAAGHLETAERFSADRLAYLPPFDPALQTPSDGRPGAASGPRVSARVGAVDVSLPNGVFGDPLLHVRLRHRRRSLIFDLGEGTRLPARLAHQATDVFISHAHIDHIAGFLWLLRSRIGEFPVCRMYGPPGLAANIDGLTRGILWDRVSDRGPCFEVGELHDGRVERFLVRAGRPGAEPLDMRPASHGTLCAEADFKVRAVTLEHSSPVLAYAFEPAAQINIRKDRLSARSLAPGPWLVELKRCLRVGDDDARIRLPDGGVETAGALASELVLMGPGKRLVYATDFADTAANRRRLIELARGAHTFFCEASFIQRDADRAERTAHLTTRACGEIARAAGVARLVPFHFSRRYEKDPSAVYQEIAEVCPAVVTPPTAVL